MGTVNKLSNQELASEIRSLEAPVMPYDEEPEADDDGRIQKDSLNLEAS